VADPMSLRRAIHWVKGGPMATMAKPHLESFGALDRHPMLELKTPRLPGLRLAGTSRYRDVSHFHGLEAL
jgi:hypothetical protein